MSMEDYNFAKAREAWPTPVKIVQYNCKCGRTMKFESEQGVIAPQRTEGRVCCQQYDICLEPCTSRGRHLAQRTWVGLTDDEIEQMGLSNYIKVVRETEAKLKEKNGA
jgi:hypothetical protein